MRTFNTYSLNFWASLVAQLVKNMPAKAAEARDSGFDPWVGKIPWRRAWQPTPVFLPGESHGQGSLVGYSPWGRKSWTRLSDPTTTTTRHNVKNMVIM